MNANKEIRDLLNDAREVIDGEMNCQTVEYRALDLLHRAAEAIELQLSEIARQVGCSEATAAKYIKACR